MSTFIESSILHLLSKTKNKTGVDIDVAQLVTACLVEMLVVGSRARVDVESGWVDGYFFGTVIGDLLSNIDSIWRGFGYTCDLCW